MASMLIYFKFQDFQLQSMKVFDYYFILFKLSKDCTSPDLEGFIYFCFSNWRYYY
jgi:hypothetical protein